MLTSEQIEQKYEEFLQFVKTDSRSEKLLAMYEDFGNVLVEAPAAAKTYFHNAWCGGYIDHVVRVTNTALELSVVYKKMGGDVDFTKQELIFAAMHHDLGKLGSPTEGPYYIDQDSDWHRKRGELYKQNDNLQYMKVPDRALFLLQKYGIEITQKEWLGIKLSDGIYDESAKSYLINYAPYAMKTNLPYIIHWADHISSRVENDKGRF
jgi:hypothetical protein